jgi:hypothetical protein
MPALLVLLLVGAGPLLPVRVQAAGSCPAAADVEARVRPLLPAGDPAVAPAVARVEQQPDGVRLTLSRPGLGTVAERRLPRVASCAAMAAAVALAIAAWQSEVRPEFPVAVPLVAAPIAISGNNQRSRIEPPRVAARAPPPLPTGPAALDLGAAAVIGRSQSWAPGVLVRASFTPRGRGFGASAVLAVEAIRTDPVGAGQVLWRRWEAAIGLQRRWRGTRAVGDAHLELGAALLDLEGAGFDRNFRHLGVSPEAAAGGRVAFPLAGGGWTLAPFLEARAVVWPRRETATASPSSARWRVPRFAGMLAAGLAAGRFR